MAEAKNGTPSEVRNILESPRIEPPPKTLDEARSAPGRAERIADIGLLFSEEWQKKSRSGWWIEAEKGKWVRKPEEKKEKGKTAQRHASRRVPHAFQACQVSISIQALKRGLSRAG